jgi:hypothetical protein
MHMPYTFAAAHVVMPCSLAPTSQGLLMHMRTQLVHWMLCRNIVIACERARCAGLQLLRRVR